MTTTTDPKAIKYDLGEFRASYEGNTIGWFNSYSEAEVALDHHASDFLRDTAVVTADMAADTAEPCPCGAAATASGLCAPCFSIHAPRLWRRRGSDRRQAMPACPGVHIGVWCGQTAGPSGLCKMCEPVFEILYPSGDGPCYCDVVVKEIDPPTEPDPTPPPCPNIMDAYCLAYGQACVELDNQIARATQRAA